MQSLQQSIL